MSYSASRRRSVPHVWLVALALSSCVSAGCAKKGNSKSTLGTLPRISVPLGKSAQPPPKPAPQEEEAQVSVTTTDLPDPPATLTDDYVRYTLRLEKGELAVTSVQDVRLSQPSPAARRVGRFAFELWLGQALLERVRFDFPLLAATAPGEEDEFENGLSAQTRVLIPRLSRATSAHVLDRKTRRKYPIDWPPPPSSPGETESPDEGAKGASPPVR